MDKTTADIQPAAEALLNTFMALAELLDAKGIISIPELADQLEAKQVEMLKRKGMATTAEMTGGIVAVIRAQGAKG